MQRFYEKVKRTKKGCWNWTASCFQSGYGSFQVNGKSVRAHRFSYELHVGKIPKGRQINHSCHNPKCVNPEHLILGTQMQNMKEMVQAGRSTKGEKHYRAKLCKCDVRKIKKLRKNGIGLQILSDLYGVNTAQIFKIAAGLQWKHV